MTPKTSQTNGGNLLPNANLGSILNSMIPMPSLSTSFSPVDLPPLQKIDPTAYAMPDMRPSWHQLVIIGNGFDLECGLPSSFASFIETREAALVGSPGDDTQACTKTIWDVILHGLDDASWCDIEGAIANWIAPEKGSSQPESTSFERTLARLDESRGCRSFIYDESKLEDKVTLYLRDRFPEESEAWDSKRLARVSRDDLAILESEFSIYLTKAVKETARYKEAVERLMCEILLWKRPNKEDFDVEESVLSFNYTRAVSVFRSDEHTTSYVNIHGRLGGEIIFGIDGTDRMDKPIAMPFTKTYRLMALDLLDTSSIVHIPPSGPSLDHGTRMIKFYGHSLGKADYSYFQAIFDAVKLYEGNTRLVFFFRPFRTASDEERSEDAARAEMMGKAINLLVAYGKTLDNKDHGKNLIHKLLIEGRLSVTLLPDEIQEG